MSDEKQIAHLKVSRCPGPQWGPDTSAENVKVLSANVLRLAEALARREYPSLQVQAELTDDYTETVLYGTPPEVISHLGVLLSDHVFAEPLYEPEFDAPTYAATVS